MVVCLLGQLVLTNDGRQLFRRLDDDGYFHLQLFRYGGGYGCRMLGLRSLGCSEYGVAAIEQRRDVCVPKFSQQGSQIGHGNSLGFANIDAAQQGHKFWHWRRLSLKFSGRRGRSAGRMAWHRWAATDEIPVMRHKSRFAPGSCPDSFS